MKSHEVRLAFLPFLLIALVPGVGPTAPAAEATPVAQGQPAPGDAATLARDLLRSAPTSKGVCSVLGPSGSGILLEIARQSEFLIHVWDPNPTSVAKVGADVDAASLAGKRIIVERGDLDRLPYADNLIDLVISMSLSDAVLDQLTPAEVLRVLRPGGTAVLGQRNPPDSGPGALAATRTEKWLDGAAARKKSLARGEGGLWIHIEKPVPEGIDDWSHWEHGPDNNPVSTDSVIKAPYMTQWLGLPYYITMPAITTAAGGRVFIAMGHIAHHEREEKWLNTLMAANGYNGTLLWARKLPDGYLAHRSAFVATPEAFWMIRGDGDGVDLLDPDTGVARDRIEIPEVLGDWKWIALDRGVLFALVGKEKDPPETTIVRSPDPHWSWGELSRGYYEPRVPWGFGTTLLAYDTKARKLLWSHIEEKPVDSRAVVLGGGGAGGGRLCFYGPDSRIGCLDAKSGAVVWTNDDPKVRDLIEERGRGLTSTPGFRTTCYALWTPKALFFEAQTHMNVVAVSLDDGRLLWRRKKTTSNPNMIYVEDHLLVGIGPDGSTLVLEPLTGETVADLGFKKRSCARLTATPDSLFCRGWPEGLTRYDRQRKKVLFNGAFRPSCNDGVIPAGGLLYAGPWTCDCNLSLMGRLALCSARDFEADPPEKRLDGGRGDDLAPAARIETTARDWPTYRGNIERTAGTRVNVPDKPGRLWEFRPPVDFQPTAPTAAGGLIFLAGDDGKVRAIDAATGALRWSYLTAGPILQPPTIWEGRAYVGSGDGRIHALDAATGRFLWCFREAPVERRIMAYGALRSTWPVNTGVLVKDGVAFAGAGIIDNDGTYICALDAATGTLRWKNDTSGHLDKDLRKGVSAQGTLTLAGGRLWMPGGNVISPASYDASTGEYAGPPPGDGSPRANRGEEIGLIGGRYIVLGGRLQFSARENVVDPGNFVAIDIAPGPTAGRAMPLAVGKIPPAWDPQGLVSVMGAGSVPMCHAREVVEKYLGDGDPKARPDPLWVAAWAQGTDTVSLVLAGNMVVTACEVSRPRSLAREWWVRCLSRDDGHLVWEQRLPGTAATGGLLVDRDGRIIVVLEDGRLVAFGAARV